MVGWMGEVRKMDRIIGTEATAQALCYSIHCATLESAYLNLLLLETEKNRMCKKWENMRDTFLLHIEKGKK